MPVLGRLATLGMAKAAASTFTVPAGTSTSAVLTSTPKVEPDSTTFPDALRTAGTAPIVVKVTSFSCMSRRMALSGSCTGLPHNTPAGTEASKWPWVSSPETMCSITQRRAPGAMNGIQIVFSVETGIGENVAASASDGVLSGSKPRLPAAATDPSVVTIRALSKVSVRAPRSAVPRQGDALRHHRRRTASLSAPSRFPATRTGKRSGRPPDRPPA